MQTTVLLLIDTLYLLGGAEKNVMQLALGLNPAKYKVSVYCLKSGPLYEDFRKKNIEVTDLNIKRIYSFDAFMKARQLIKKIRYEKVKIMITYFESSDFWGSIVARIAGVPIVLSSRRDMGFNLKPRHVWAYRIFNHLFTRIITNCHAVRDSIIGREKVHPDKMVTIYNGVATGRNGSVSDIETFKKSLGLDVEKKIITMVAVLHPVKGQEILLKATSMIVRKYPSLQVLLVGADDKGYRKQLENLTAQLGITSHVVLSGHRSDISEILSISDIAVLSSTSEGFSNSLIEYMAAEKPVVATDVGGNKEIVVNNETGFIVPARNPAALAEKIASLLGDESLCMEMGKKARERACNSFSERKMIDKVEALFDTIGK